MRFIFSQKEFQHDEKCCVIYICVINIVMYHNKSKKMYN